LEDVVALDMEEVWKVIVTCRFGGRWFCDTQELNAYCRKLHLSTAMYAILSVISIRDHYPVYVIPSRWCWICKVETRKDTFQTSDRHRETLIAAVLL